MAKATRLSAWLLQKFANSILFLNRRRSVRVHCSFLNLLLVLLLFATPTLTFGQEDAKEDAPGQRKPSVEQLTKRLADENIEKRIDTLQELQALGPKASPAMETILKLLDDTRVDIPTLRRVSDEAAKALQAIGSVGIDRVITEIQETKDMPRYHSLALALHIFGTDADSAAGFLVDKLKTTQNRQHYMTMYALSTMGKAAVPALPEFVDDLSDKDFHTQAMACDCVAALSQHTKIPSSAVEQIMLLVIDGVGSARMHAATALGDLGVRSEVDIVGALIDATEDRHFLVQSAAVKSLAKLGRSAGKALPKLRELMKDEKYRNSVPAAVAVWKISGSTEDSVAELLKIIEQKDFELDCVDALAEMKSGASKAVPRLAKLLSSKDPDLQMQSARAIGLIGTSDSKVREAIKALTEAKDKDVQNAATQAMRRLNDASPE